MEEKQFIEEWVQQNRAEKREQFGEIGLHDDCVNFRMAMGKPTCLACIDYKKGHGRTTKNTILQCEMGMCYFYEPKRKENNDGND